jgi:hypothetical protein
LGTIINQNKELLSIYTNSKTDCENTSLVQCNTNDFEIEFNKISDAIAHNAEQNLQFEEYNDDLNVDECCHMDECNVASDNGDDDVYNYNNTLF